MLCPSHGKTSRDILSHGYIIDTNVITLIQVIPLVKVISKLLTLKPVVYVMI